MAYVPKRLFLGRCRRCGKPIYKSDEAFQCPKCSAYICSTCNMKVKGKCPVCFSELREI